MLLGTLGDSMLEICDLETVRRKERWYINMNHIDKMFTSTPSFKQYWDW